MDTVGELPPAAVGPEIARDEAFGNSQSSLASVRRGWLGHGQHFAWWSLTIRGRRPLSFQIEDEGSLRTALAHLPQLLRPALTVSGTLNEPSGRTLRVNEGPGP